MTRTLESQSCPAPARRPSVMPLPVLIRVPALVGAGSGCSRRAVGRRRLRREFRVAGCWLLALIPAGLACATWGGDHPPSLLALNPPQQADGTVAGRPGTSPSNSTISLSLEPATLPVTGPVTLTGQLLPAEPAEEPAHGGH